MRKKAYVVASLILITAYLGFFAFQDVFAQSSIGSGNSPVNQTQPVNKSSPVKMPATQKAAPILSPAPQSGYYLAFEKIYLVKNSIHLTLKNTGPENIPVQSFSMGKISLKSISFDRKWTLSEVDPGQMLNKFTKTVDFDTKCRLKAAELVTAALENLKGDKSKQVKLAPALAPGNDIKAPVRKSGSIGKPSGRMRSENLIPAGVHSEGILISAPRMGERYMPGATLMVRYSLRPNTAAYGAVPTSFRVILYDEVGAGHTYPIYEGPSTETSYILPADIPQSDKYKVYVAGVDNLHYYCTTGHFTIRRLSLGDGTSTLPSGGLELAPYLYVDAPEDYATWNKGCSYTVSWRSNVAPASATLSLYKAGSGLEYAVTRPSTVTTIREGSYSASFWVPNGPDVPSSGAYYGYRLKVVVDNAGTPLSGQGGALKIQESSMTVNKPNGTMSACRGYPIDITWSYAGCRGRTYRIILLRDLPLGGEPVVISPSVAFAPSTDVGGYLFQQTYSWSVPADIREGTYRIQVETNPVSFAETPVSGTGRQFMIHDCD